MSTPETDVAEPHSAPSHTDPGRQANAARPKKVILGFLGLGLVVYLLVLGSQALSIYNDDIPKILQAVVGTLGGVAGAYFLYYFLNMMIEGLPRRLSLAILPYAFILPSIGMLGIFLIYPTIQTIVYSFANADSTAWVGVENYKDVISSPEFRITIGNNLLWIAIVPAVTVVTGLVIATLADKLSARWEKVAKAIIFLPMAISFVGASAIWRFVYAANPAGEEQIGLLNAIVVKLGFDPVTWLTQSQWSINDMLLMVILIWLQTGFAMVLLSSAIKGVPAETLEAARIDGANELQIFFKVIVPQIRGTIITVFITVLIMVLKVFDIVYVMTNGNFKTSVIGLDFFQAIFINGQAGIASAIVVILMIAIIPVLIYQVHHFREEEKTR